YLAHRLFGAPPDQTNVAEKAAPLECVRHYPAIEVSIQRTADKFFSFSWKNRVMGMLVPIGTSFENNPHFTIPIRDGFVGSIEPNGGNKAKTDVVEHMYKETKNGFETTGTLLTNDNQVTQTLSILSVGKKVVVYQDQVRAVADVTVARKLGVP